MTLKGDISKAITTQNYEMLLELKEICDLLHDGEEVEGYSVNDLPKDALYEEMCKLIEKLETSVTIRSIQASTHEVKITKLDDYFMGSVPKLPYIEDITDVIIMPKYDGCSCGITININKETDKYQIFKARTRGQVVSKKMTTKKTATRNYQDITGKVAMITNDLINALNKMPKTTIIGESPLGEIKEIVIRGEIVLSSVEDFPNEVAAPCIAGKINGGLEVWTEFVEKGGVVFKPFEVVRIVSYKTYTISQLEAHTFFNDLKLNCPFILAKRLRPTVKSEQYIMNLFNTNFNNSVKEPLDGIVYCHQGWKYPYTKDDNGKSDYGKYAWKPTNEASSIIREIIPTRSKDGRIDFSCIYDPVPMNGKEYTKCKIVPTVIEKFKGTFGIGSVVTVLLREDISPYIETCDLPDDMSTFTEWHFPEICPDCGSELSITVKGKSTTIKCPNDQCNGTLRMVIADAISKTLKIKGFAEKSIDKFFKETGIKQYSLFSLLSDNRSKKAFVEFAKIKDLLDVGTFFKLAFPTVNGTKQVEKLLASYGVDDDILSPIVQHRALLNSMLKDTKLSFHTKEVCKLFIS